MHIIPMIITCMLQGTLCDTGIPRTFYGGNIFIVDLSYVMLVKFTVEISPNFMVFSEYMNFKVVAINISSVVEF